MRTKIANLEVYLDDSTEGHPSGLLRGPHGQYQLILKPEVDKRLSPNTAKIRGTIMAHELGHFVSFVTGMESHEKVLRASVGGTREKPVNPKSVEAEEDAWRFAHIINPDLDTEYEQLALDTYRMDRLMKTLRMLGALKKAA